MNQPPICILKTDATIGKSILTADPPEDEIKPNSTVSIPTIAKLYNLDTVFVADSSFVNFIKLYKEIDKLNKQLVFGVTFNIVEDSFQKNEESQKTESKVIVWMKNSAGYKDLCKLYSCIHANKERFYYHGRGDWQLLRNMMTENLLLTIDFYDGFIAKNLLKYQHAAIPDFGQIDPVFLLCEHELPFDKIIRERTVSYCKSNNYKTKESHFCYYFSPDYFDAYAVFRCINAREKYETPNLDYFCSKNFGFTGYLDKINNK